MIIMAAVFLVAVVIFFFAFPVKEEVFSMNRLRNVYLYLVSFVALMMIIGGLIFTVQNIMDVIYPTSYNYDPYPVGKDGTMTAEQKQQYEENQKRNEENRRMESKKSVAKSVAVVVVALPVFAYHWRKIEKEKKEQVS